MINSLEIRSPYLDYNYIDCIRKIPSEFKLKGNISKYILKKTFQKHFNKKFLNRKKMGFSAPLSKWLLNMDQIHMKSEFLKNKNHYINEKLFEHKNFIKENRLYLWNIISLDNFLLKNGY